MLQAKRIAVEIKMDILNVLCVVSFKQCVCLSKTVFAVLVCYAFYAVYVCALRVFVCILYACVCCACVCVH